MKANCIRNLEPCDSDLESYFIYINLKHFKFSMSQKMWQIFATICLVVREGLFMIELLLLKVLKTSWNLHV